MNINDRLKKLRPYVIGLRFSETIPLIDCEFNDYWKLEDSNKIHFVKNGEGTNYICYSESPEITIDDLFDFIEKTINFNLDEEEKVTLFKLKLNELKVLFETNNLEKVKTLEFNFKENNKSKNLVDDKDLYSTTPILNDLEQSKILNKQPIELKINNQLQQSKVISEPLEKVKRIEFNENDNYNSVKNISPVCRCKDDERCSVCLGID